MNACARSVRGALDGMTKRSIHTPVTGPPMAYPQRSGLERTNRRPSPLHIWASTTLPSAIRTEAPESRSSRCGTSISRSAASAPMMSNSAPVAAPLDQLLMATSSAPSCRPVTLPETSGKAAMRRKSSHDATPSGTTCLSQAYPVYPTSRHTLYRPSGSNGLSRTESSWSATPGTRVASISRTRPLEMAAGRNAPGTTIRSY